MLRRLRSLRLSLLLAYALVLQGLVLAQAASAQHTNAAWCATVAVSGDSDRAPVSPTPSSADHDRCCLAACHGAGGVAMLGHQADGAARVACTSTPFVAEAQPRPRDAAHPWSSRAPPRA